MRTFATIALSLFLLAMCKKQSEEVKTDETIISHPADSIAPGDTLAYLEAGRPAASPLEQEKAKYATFGARFTPSKVLSKSQMLKKYKSMKAGDTLKVQFASDIKEVCKKKGCWMSMDLGTGQESFVRFKDYGFFVPLNADASPAIVNGKAYIDVVSVAQLKHYAKDGGKSAAEIAKITKPKVTYAFQADGVMIRE